MRRGILSRTRINVPALITIKANSSRGKYQRFSLFNKIFNQILTTKNFFIKSSIKFEACDVTNRFLPPRPLSWFLFFWPMLGLCFILFGQTNEFSCFSRPNRFKNRLVWWSIERLMIKSSALNASANKLIKLNGTCLTFFYSPIGSG